MRIYGSKFNDYYDVVQGFGGTDNNVVYHREVRLFKRTRLEYLDDLAKRFIPKQGLSKDVKAAIFGFCGKLYPLYVYPWRYASQFISPHYNLDLLKLFEELDGMRNCYPKIKTRSKETERLAKTVKQFSLEDYHYDIRPFVELEDPIFLYGPEAFDIDLLHLLGVRESHESMTDVTAVTNFCLKEIDFHRYLDPYQCFQEIEMFVGNTLTKPEVITEPGDKLKRDLHGFDELSFKNSSPGKKEKRKHNKLSKRLKQV